MKKLFIITILLFAFISIESYAQSCSSIAIWSGSNRGGSGLYYTGEVVRLNGQTSTWTPRYGSTTCHLTDFWCRNDQWAQWRRVGTCSNVCNTPSIYGVTNGSRNGSGRVNIRADVSPGAVVRWYSSSGAYLGQSGDNQWWATPNISSTTTFYAEAYVTCGRRSSRRAVIATINTVGGGGSERRIIIID